MVFLVNFFGYIFFFFFFFIILKLNLLYTVYFFFISSLNYLWINLFYLFYFYFNFFVKFKLMCLCIFFKFFFINSILEQIIFIEELLITLISGTMLIHPIAFYFFSCIFLTNFFFYKRFSYLILTPTSNLNLLTYLWLTLFLGGFWATQSNSWGYYWVNDWVEWILLLIIIFIVINIHIIYHKVNTFSFFISYLFIINLLIFTRFGFLSTRHNFIVLNTISIISVLIFYLIVYWGFKNFNLNTRKYVYNTIFWLFLFLKYLFLIYFMKFLHQIAVYFFRYKYFHVFFFIFFFIWILYFYFFFINYTKSFCISIQLGEYFNGILLGNKVYLFSQNYFNNLSFINFEFNFYTNLRNLLSNYQIVILLNNYQLFFLFSLLLV